MNGELTVFNPTAVWEKSFDEKTFAPGKFGEWFFNFNGRFCEIRTDALRSSQGTEVVLLNRQEHKAWNVLRVVLCILIVPAVVALIDRVIHRWNHEQFHFNPLPDQWRNKDYIFVTPDGYQMTGMIDGKARPSRTLEGAIEALQKAGRHYTIGSIFALIVQKQPWENPECPFFYLKTEHGIDSLQIRSYSNKTDVEQTIQSHIRERGPLEHHFGTLVQTKHSEIFTLHPLWIGAYSLDQVPSGINNKPESKFSIYHINEYGKYYLRYSLGTDFKGANYDSMTGHPLPPLDEKVPVSFEITLDDKNNVCVHPSPKKTYATMADLIDGEKEDMHRLAVKASESKRL